MVWVGVGSVFMSAFSNRTGQDWCKNSGFIFLGWRRSGRVNYHPGFSVGAGYESSQRGTGGEHFRHCCHWSLQKQNRNQSVSVWKQNLLTPLQLQYPFILSCLLCEGEEPPQSSSATSHALFLRSMELSVQYPISNHARSAQCLVRADWRPPVTIINWSNIYNIEEFWSQMREKYGIKNIYSKIICTTELSGSINNLHKENKQGKRQISEWVLFLVQMSHLEVLSWLWIFFWKLCRIASYGR